jgi:hypothetical protein
VVSHLDNQRKIHLFDEISKTNLQSFFSATSRDLIPKQKLQDLEVVEF